MAGCWKNLRFANDTLAVMANHSFFFPRLHYVGVGVSVVVILPCTCIVKPSGGVSVIHLLFVHKNACLYEAAESLLQEFKVTQYHIM